MKKIIPLLLILCLLISACANAGNGASKANGKAKNSTAEPGAIDKSGDAQDTIEPEPFSLYPAYLQLPLGQHVTLDAQPEGRKLSWASSNPSIATVDENGRIAPVAEGETIITCAAADDPSITAACGVLVVAEGNIYLWDEED